MHGLLALMYFNPLRREGGDDGLTGQLDSLGRISIHSAARAETFSSGSSSVGIIHFNPLRREGGDIPALKPLIILPISIHSAARAETSNLLIYLGQTEHFNPLRREGGDKAALTELIGDIPISIHSAARAETICCYFFLWYMKFQSTPPRGRRRPDW